MTENRGGLRIGDFTSRLLRAHLYAGCSAWLRGLPLVTIEDLLVGLRHFMGRRMFRYFKTRSAVEELIVKTCPEVIKPRRVIEAVLKSRPHTKESPNAFFFVPLRQTGELALIWQLALNIARSRLNSQADLDDMMEALARSDWASEALGKHGIHFQDPESVRRSARRWWWWF